MEIRILKHTKSCIIYKVSYYSGIRESRIYEVFSSGNKYIFKLTKYKDYKKN